MYAIKVSYGDYGDEPAMATAEILGTYESLDEACEAAKSKFDAIMRRICEYDTRFGEIERGRCRYYVLYGRVELDEYYYMVSVVEG